MKEVSRREVIKHLGLGLGAAAVTGAGCIPPANRCAGGPGSTPAAGAPLPPGGPLAGIDTFVVVMMENRSFDNGLGALRMDRSYPGAATVDGLSGQETNQDPEGLIVSPWKLTGAERWMPTHAWQASHQAYDGGLNDGFIRTNTGPDRNQVMGYFDRERIPLHYALADRFTVCDRWFASAMGPTWPNRFYLHAATSQGRRENLPIGFDGPATIWERMADRCQATRNYFAGPFPWYAAAFPAKATSGNDAVVPARIGQFYADALSGNLPPFSIIDPDFLSNDGHPIHDIALAEAFLASIYRAMAESPQWKRSLLVITYDEHGGFFDHVAPPATADPRPDFRQLGFRVPALLIGPQVWQGKVVSTPFEHVSVAATLAARFGIESLGERMDAARDLSSCIDPERLNAPAAAPLDLPRVRLTRAQTRAALGRPTSQRELEQALADGRIPERMVDPRSTEARLRGWLRWGEELEAVRVVG
jgi:phospholipase C